MNFASKSQAGQDAFTNAIIQRLDGTFLDVGCGHPCIINNTYALEQLGWTGLLVDNSEEAIVECKLARRNPAIRANAVSMDWNAALHKYLPSWSGGVIDFLSLDIDQWTAEALNRIMNEGAVFRVITIEHDAYRNGDALRAPIRKRLGKHNYDLVCADVRHDGLPYEDWFVMPDLVDMSRVERFRSTGLDWADVLRQGNALQ